MKRSLVIGYRVLVVDNDADLLVAAREQIADLEGVVLGVASSVDEARERIASDFYHLAIVDLKLHQNFDSGIEVLQMLREMSPSCERYAMTRLASQDPHGVLRVINPYDPLVRGILSKQNRRQNSEEFAHLIAPKARELQALSATFNDLRPIIDSVLKSRRILAGSSRTSDAIEFELRTILQRLFGGRVPNASKDSGAILEAGLVTQGISGAVAFSVIPVVSARPKRYGSRCFVKVGERSAISKEVERFRNRVQLNVPLKFRVELLGSVSGDRIGAVAYSFAGGSSSDVRSLDEVVSAEGIGSDVVVKVIDALFDPKEGNWYRLPGPDKSIGAFFEEELRSNFVERLPILRNACKKIAKERSAQVDFDRGELSHGGTRLALPRDDLYGSGFLSRRRPTCLIHGDMHGGNVLLNGEGQLYLIDFANAGFGPQALDAAVLQGSIRLWDAQMLSGDGDLWIKLESLVQKERVRAHRWLDQKPRSPRSVIGWERTADAVDKGVRANFGKIAAEDVLWVYLLHAARLATLNIGELGRLRLLAWFTGVKAALGV